MTAIAADEDLPTITEPYFVIDDFLPPEFAKSMRADIDRHFANPELQGLAHQIWNYWYVPGNGAHLRTQPQRLMGVDKVESFISCLRPLTASRLGLSFVTEPILSLHVGSCSDQFRAGAIKGRFAFVYSLTSPVRRTTGGGLILTSGISGAFRETIEPRFNRLVLFDERVIHAVEKVEGSMDPADGRFVLQGYVRDEGPLIGGALTMKAIKTTLHQTLSGFVSLHGEEVRKFDGPISVRFLIEPRGNMARLCVLMDRVIHLEEGYAERWAALRAKYLASLSTARFPPAEGPTSVILPINFGGQRGLPLG